MIYTATVLNIKYTPSRSILISLFSDQVAYSLTLSHLYLYIMRSLLLRNIEIASLK